MRLATSPSATPARTTSVPFARTSAFPSGERFAVSRVRESSPGFERSWAMARLIDGAPRAITVRIAMPTNLRVAMTHRRYRDIHESVLVPESVVPVRLRAGIGHPRGPVDHEHVGIAAGLEGKRDRKASPTRYIREEDLVGSPPIEVSRKGHLLGSRGIQTEAKERHDRPRIWSDGHSAGQGLPGQRRHHEDEAQRESRGEIPAHGPWGPQEIPGLLPRP